MGKYELLYIVHPDLESSIDKITDRIKSSITAKEGKITYEENWGKRKLAYPIKKTDTGIYILVYFEAPKESLAKIERDLRLTEEIIRFLIVAKEEKIAAKTAKKPALELVKEEPKVKEAKKLKEEKEEKAEKPKKGKVLRSKASESEAQSRTFIKSAVEKPSEESEEERMKKLDEKLGAILGKEDEK